MLVQHYSQSSSYRGGNKQVEKYCINTLPLLYGFFAFVLVFKLPLKEGKAIKISMLIRAYAK